MAGAGVALLAEILKIVKKINPNSPLRFSTSIGPILIDAKNRTSEMTALFPKLRNHHLSFSFIDSSI